VAPAQAPQRPGRGRRTAENSAILDEILASGAEIICCAEGRLSKEIAAMRHKKENR
jgi:hypothetical protein